jgi:hypothetical protein
MSSTSTCGRGAISLRAACWQARHVGMHVVSPHVPPPPMQLLMPFCVSRQPDRPQRVRRSCVLARARVRVRGWCMRSCMCADTRLGVGDGNELPVLGLERGEHTVLFPNLHVELAQDSAEPVQLGDFRPVCVCVSVCVCVCVCACVWPTYLISPSSRLKWSRSMSNCDTSITCAHAHTTTNDGRLFLRPLQSLWANPATSAPGLGSPLPRPHQDWTRPCHICTGTGGMAAGAALARAEAQSA